MGGDGEGGFVFEETEDQVDAAKAAAQAERDLQLDHEIEETLSEADQKLTQNQIVGMNTGKGYSKAKVTSAVQRLAASPLSPVQVEPGRRGSLFYSIDED
jgi:hypothetical protein